MISNAG